MEQSLRGAAGQHAPSAAGVGGADHDEGCVLLLGEPMESMCGRGIGNRLGLDGTVEIAAQTLEQLIAVLAQIRLELGVESPAGPGVVGEDVDEHELSAGDGGQAAREGDGVVRAFRLVDADDDLAHDRPFSRGCDADATAGRRSGHPHEPAAPLRRTTDRCGPVARPRARRGRRGAPPADGRCAA